MRYFILTLLITAKLANAEVDALSISGGVQSFGTQFGHTLQISSPYFFKKKWSIQAQLSIMNYSETQQYFLFESGLLTVIYETEVLRLGFKTMLEFFFNQTLSIENSKGLHYSFTGEYLMSSMFSLSAEVGFSLAWQTYVTNSGGDSYGLGPTFLIGPRIYLY